jgi:hypothetical protein
MNRSTLARRYAPLVALAAIQLLIIAVVPSKAPNSQAAAASGPGASVGAGDNGGAAAGAAGGTDAQGNPVAGGGAAATSGGTAGGSTATGGGGAAGTSGGTAGGAGAGDTSHCVGGRTFDPAIAYFAPPCVAGTPGATGLKPGATAPGVTDDTITIVDYISNYGAEVNAILQAEGLLETYDQGKVLDAAIQNFLNAKFVLYGRKIKVITYAGQCTSVPPDKQCLIPEMDKIVDTYHPYMVNWQTTLCSECFAELARKKTIAIGGVGFSDAFTNAQSGYFYSAGESSTRIEGQFAEMWCKQMQNTPVKFAGTQNPAQNFNGKPRVLGIISTNDPDNQSTVQDYLVPLLKKCGQDVTHFYFYDQNINTAAQQVEAGIAAMDTTTNPATTVLCLCDAVAPAFLYNGEQHHNYWPENVLADVQGMGNDSTGQSYEGNSDGSASLGCPTPSQGCEYDVAFGLLAQGNEEPQDNDAGVRIFHAGGGQGAPPVSGTTATSVGQTFVMMASLIQNTGPNLTPANMQARAPSLGTVGGGSTGNALLGFGKDNWNWTQDARYVYFSKTKKSPYNGKPGGYVQMGPRYNFGQYESRADGPPVPSNRAS